MGLVNDHLFLSTTTKDSPNFSNQTTTFLEKKTNFCLPTRSEFLHYPIPERFELIARCSAAIILMDYKLLGTSVCSVVRPFHCRNSCNFCRKSGNFDSKFRKIGEKKLRKVQKSGCSKKPWKGCRSSKFLPNSEPIPRSNDPENEISSQKCGSPRGGGVKFLQKLQKFDFSDF